MKTIYSLLFATLIAGCAGGLSGCGETHSTTVIKKETKIDSNGNEHTKIETKTVETTDRGNEPAPRERVIIEEKKDPIVKIGPLEIRK